MVNARDDLPVGLLPGTAAPPVEWRRSAALVPYAPAVAAMEGRADAIAAGRAGEIAWLIEHPAVYTAGTSASPEDVIDPRFPVFRSGRGGQVTYHGPGQRVVYLMLDLKRRTPDIRRFVATLEEWLIRSLAALGVAGERREDRIGVWVPRTGGGGREDKIAAIGIRVRRFVTLHGVSLNVAPDLSHFSGIVPCGVAAPQFGVTSLADLGVNASLREVDAVLRREFVPLFGATQDRSGDPPEFLAAQASEQIS